MRRFLVKDLFYKKFNEEINGLNKKLSQDPKALLENCFVVSLTLVLKVQGTKEIIRTLGPLKEFVAC